MPRLETIIGYSYQITVSYFMNFVDDQIETKCGHLHIVSNCDQDTDSDYRYRLSQHIVGVLSVIGTE